MEWNTSIPSGKPGFLCRRDGSAGCDRRRESTRACSRNRQLAQIGAQWIEEGFSTDRRCSWGRFFLGVELVQDPLTREPAPLQAGYIVERMKSKRILLSTEGPGHNVLKFKPPMVFGRKEGLNFLKTWNRFSGKLLFGRSLIVLCYGSGSKG